jgi:hypothetical protein
MNHATPIHFVRKNINNDEVALRSDRYESELSVEEAVAALADFDDIFEVKVVKGIVKAVPHRNEMGSIVINRAVQAITDAENAR